MSKMPSSHSPIPMSIFHGMEVYRKENGKLFVSVSGGQFRPLDSGTSQLASTEMKLSGLTIMQHFLDSLRANMVARSTLAAIVVAALCVTNLVMCGVVVALILGR